MPGGPLGFMRLIRVGILQVDFRISFKLVFISIKLILFHILFGRLNSEEPLLSGVIKFQLERTSNPHGYDIRTFKVHFITYMTHALAERG